MSSAPVPRLPRPQTQARLGTSSESAAAVTDTVTLHSLIWDSEGTRLTVTVAFKLAAAAALPRQLAQVPVRDPGPG